MQAVKAKTLFDQRLSKSVKDSVDTSSTFATAKMKRLTLTIVTAGAPNVSMFTGCLMSQRIHTSTPATSLPYAVHTSLMKLYLLNYQPVQQLCTEHLEDSRFYPGKGVTEENS